MKQEIQPHSQLRSSQLVNISQAARGWVPPQTDMGAEKGTFVDYRLWKGVHKLQQATRERKMMRLTDFGQ